MDFVVSIGTLNYDGAQIEWAATVKDSDGDSQNYTGYVPVQALSTAVSLNNAIATAARDEFTSEFGLEYNILTDKTLMCGPGFMVLT